MPLRHPKQTGPDAGAGCGTASDPLPIPTIRPAEYPLLSFAACDLAIRQRNRLQRFASRHYYELMASEYQSIKPHLPMNMRRLLDIGGGLGGIHLFTHRHSPSGVDVHLLDRDSIDPVMKYGFRDSTEAYNSFNESRNYLVSGGLPDNSLHFWNADIPAHLHRLSEMRGQFDAIISLKSWCFHYPSSAYLMLVDQILGDDGVLIVDVRRDTEQTAQITELFTVCTQLGEDQHSHRLCFQRH